MGSPISMKIHRSFKIRPASRCHITGTIWEDLGCHVPPRSNFRTCFDDEDNHPHLGDPLEI